MSSSTLAGTAIIGHARLGHVAGPVAGDPRILDLVRLQIRRGLIDGALGGDQSRARDVNVGQGRLLHRETDLGPFGDLGDAGDLLLAQCDDLAVPDDGEV